MPEITVRINGKPVTVPSGTLVAAAILRSGAAWCRLSVNGEPRGPLCGMGICFECRATVDGTQHVRTCQRLCEPGMDIVLDTLGHSVDGISQSGKQSAVDMSGRAQATVWPEHDVIVVGAGPAGLAAAASAAEGGRSRILLLDDNLHLGGQIWRGEEQSPASQEAKAWREKVHAAGVEILRGARVFDAPMPGVLLVETWDGIRILRYQQLILATGARERFLPFPGWTLPNVMGAGGLQALVKSGVTIERKRVVVAGTGPLLLAVAAYLKAHGAEITAIAEQAPQARLARFAVRLLAMPGKLAQAFSLKRQLAGVSYLTSCWPVAAHGSTALESVTLLHHRRRWDVACDYLACGFHLIPNIELAVLLGCRLNHGFVAVDDLQATSVPKVYCAGEPTGIGGVESAIVEGRIAGLAVAGKEKEARRWVAARSRLRRFAQAMDRAFDLRPELRRVSDDTLLCRCEDVPLGRVRAYRGWREAKLHTRCGMGPCQGRVCGGAASFLFGWETESVRPPIFPAKVAHVGAVEGFG